MADNSALKDYLKDMQAKRNDEQAEFQELNGRFASYIAKIRSLKQQNETLEVELNLLKSSESKHELYEEEMDNLRKDLENQKKEKSILNDRLQKANNEKEEALKKLASLKEDSDASTQASKFLEEEIKTLRDQLAFQNKIHKEKTQEFEELKIQFKEVKNNVQNDGPNSHLAAVLRELKAQIQKSADTQSSEREKWYKTKISEMKEMLNNNKETLRKVNQENSNLKNQNQKILNVISSLNAKIEEMEENSETLQKTITTLENENDTLKNDMDIQLLDYKELLKVKGDLDEELAEYRELLEEEEFRLQGNLSS